MSQITSPQYRKAFILVTTLFFMWGLSYGLIDVLNKHFQVTLNVSKAQSGLIQAAYFGAYFVVAIPAGLFMEWKGYKAGILCGLSLYAIGALLFVPAAGVASFTFFLFALFVIALGLGCLETAANSYSSALGSTETAETRLNLSQSFNGLGQFTGPLLGGLLFFGGDEASGGGGLDAVRMTYVGIACVVILLVILFAKAELPDLRSSEEADEAAMMKHSLLAHKEFVAGVAAQFLYVAAQVGIGAFFINLYIECWPGGTAQQGAFFLSIAMLCLLIGRFVSTGIMTKIAPAKLLAAYGAVCVILTGVVFTAVEYVHFHHVPDHFCDGDQEPRDPQEARRLVHDHGYRGRGDHAVFYGADRGLHAHRGGVSPAAVLLRLRRPVRCGIWAAGEGITGRRGLPPPVSKAFA